MPSRAALVRHPVALAGALLTTAAAVVFVVLLIAELWGLFDNPYAGLVVFVVIPALVVLGLLLIPFGMWLEHRRLSAHPGAEREWFVIDFRSAGTRRRALLVLALTAVNVMIVLLAGYGSLHYMESPAFCGQTCHTPMHPQFTAWQDAPHSRGRLRAVPRRRRRSRVRPIQTERHAAAVSRRDGRLRAPDSRRGRRFPSGARGVRHLPLVRQGLRRHHPHQAGIRRRRAEYRNDARSCRCTWEARGANARAGAPSIGTPTRAMQVEYVFTDADRQTIPYVRVTDAQGQVREFTAEGATPADIAKGQRRTMDCIDCHNVVAHRVAPTAEQAVDRAIASGADQRRAAVRPARRRAADESQPRDRGRRRADHRGRIAAVLRVARARRRPERRRRRDVAADASIGATSFRP